MFASPHAPFAALSHQRQVHLSRKLCKLALKEWGISDAKTRLLVHGENTTFAITLPSGERRVLRIHRPGYQSDAAIRSEMTLLRRVREAGVGRAPVPLTSKNGNEVEMIHSEGMEDGRRCVLFEWQCGRFLDRQLRPRHLREAGAFLGRLHALSHAQPWPEDFERMHLPSTTRLGALWSLVADEEEDEELLALTRSPLERVQRWYARGQEAQRDVVLHADLHLRNFLFDGEELVVIDFDDAGFGPAALDLAITLTSLTHREDAGAMYRALLEGYASEQPLDGISAEELAGLMQCHELDVLGWLVKRRDNAKLQRLLPGFRTRVKERLRRYDQELTEVFCEELERLRGA